MPAFLTPFTTAASAGDFGDRVDRRMDRKGERIEHRLDQRGDRIDRRLETLVGIERNADIAELVESDAPAVAAQVRMLRVHGRADDGDVTRAGLNSRLDTMQAAVLLTKLEVFDDELRARPANLLRVAGARDRRRGGGGRGLRSQPKGIVHG